VANRGSKCSRPSLNRLIAHAHQRRFDGILVWKLDRFGRSLRHLVTALAELEALGITFISLKDNWDLSTPSGRLMFQIVGAMAEFERELIRERIRAGMRSSAQRRPSGSWRRRRKTPSRPAGQSSRRNLRGGLRRSRAGTMPRFRGSTRRRASLLPE